MASLPVKFAFGSQSSVVDAIESYRRAQLYYSDSVSASADEAETDDDLVIDEENDLRTPRPGSSNHSYDAIVNNLAWDDEELAPGPSTPTPVREFLVARPSIPTTPRPSSPNNLVPRSAHERTPLLRQITPLTLPHRPFPRRPKAKRAGSGSSKTGRRRSNTKSDSGASRLVPTDTTVSSEPPKFISTGQSTFGQTLFNTIAMLLGIGMLSEPLAFAYAGWIGGTLIIIVYGLVACYTAKILAHIIFVDPRLRSYSDIGRKAFGPRSGPWISALFCLELFTVSVALVTLFADSLHSVEPSYSPTFYKLVGLLIIIPTTLMPLSLLSYTSMLGVISTLLIVIVVFIDGFSKLESPGSLWSPADTNWKVQDLGELGMSFGLFMAGFAGHAVIPSLAKDMADPSQFDTMIDCAFVVATFIYAAIGIAGYLMFGNSVSGEFSQDLMLIPGYNTTLNQIALWGLVLTPLSKYALSARPMSLTIEMILGIDTSPHHADDHGISSKPDCGEVPTGHATQLENAVVLKRMLTTIERMALAVLSVVVSVLVPGFSSMMAFLGAFSAFLLTVIGPISAKISLSGRASSMDIVLLVVGLVMAVWGTASAFWSAV